LRRDRRPGWVNCFPAQKGQLAYARGSVAAVDTQDFILSRDGNGAFNFKVQKTKGAESNPPLNCKNQLIRGGNFSCDELEGLKGGRGFRRAAFASAIVVRAETNVDRCSFVMAYEAETVSFSSDPTSVSVRI